MSLFLSLKSVESAKITLKSIAGKKETEITDLTESHRRTLAEDITSPMDLPGFSRSIVDGYAVFSRDTLGASESLPAMPDYTGRVEMGQPAAFEIKPGSCAYVPTGGNVPDGADAVAMIEYCEEIGDQVLIYRPMADGENIVFANEDFAESEVVLKAGTTLRPQECGVLAALGFLKISVFRRPVVGIISTGNELVPVGEVPGFGKVRDVNSMLCSGFAEKHGCIPKRYGIVADDRQTLFSAVKTAAEECDIVLISGGSSKDLRDNTSLIIDELGEVLIHGIAISPGKPTIIGKALEKPVIGLPGHPASAYVVLHILISELLEAYRDREAEFSTKNMTLTQNISSAQGREDYIRVKITPDGAVPVFGKSGLLNTLINSDGVLKIPAGSEGLEAGENVEVILW
ncbi:molybdopterin molybdotransferase MoeA [Methanoplanus endosymbiosus]|uniref:Molybdopterin molybdotransferase MoeA n=1 Tax=Methanoplanus endosymbiosus TaxID=33865 RepID=A0A9E7THZ1_9EURY|nr:gephyrin-like molybdotransferase Glp [Methanoplanus endosymbiosus]UUX91573.1 molybdopterin molybdotransferase MoeA [Methanoplanus endosymbiosus]